MSIEQDARTEAEKRYPDDVMQLALGEVNLADQPRAAFIAGAEWQASRPITDGEVERAVAGIQKRLAWPSLHWGAEGLHPDALSHIARAALEAARADKEQGNE